MSPGKSHSEHAADMQHLLKETLCSKDCLEDAINKALTRAGIVRVSDLMAISNDALADLKCPVKHQDNTTTVECLPLGP